MTSKQKLCYKKELYQNCIVILKERIAAIAASMENAQAAANSEEKSSAGDKYETSRAMSHLEKDMQGRQLAANQNELSALLTINCNKLYSSPCAGCIVILEEAAFFIALGLGKIVFQKKLFFLISPNAPVAKSLQDKVKGSKIIFNNKEMIVEDVF